MEHLILPPCRTGLCLEPRSTRIRNDGGKVGETTPDGRAGPGHLQTKAILTSIRRMPHHRNTGSHRLHSRTRTAVRPRIDEQVDTFIAKRVNQCARNRQIDKTRPIDAAEVERRHYPLELIAAERANVDMRPAARVQHGGQHLWIAVRRGLRRFESAPCQCRREPIALEKSCWRSLGIGTCEWEKNRLEAHHASRERARTRCADRLPGHPVGRALRWGKHRRGESATLPCRSMPLLTQQQPRPHHRDGEGGTGVLAAAPERSAEWFHMSR